MRLLINNKEEHRYGENIVLITNNSPEICGVQDFASLNK